MTEPTVAYFSAEYAIADDMPIYAGGLGVLAADMVLEAGQQDRDFHAIGLVYHLAFTGDDHDQRPMTERLASNGFEVAKAADTGEKLIAWVNIAGRMVELQAWVKRWGRTQLILLDANLSQNLPEDRAICDRLYASNPSLQLAQEMCLGFGGVSMLEQLGVNPDVYHLNEGHTALAGLAVVLRQMKDTGISFGEAVAVARPKLVGTKHTILAGAGILLDWGSVEYQMGPVLREHRATIDELKDIAGLSTGDYSDTRLMIELTRIASGVSKIHVAQELRDHSESRLITITNGVFRGRWAAESWGDDPLALSDAELWERHNSNRRELLTLVNAHTDFPLDPDALTIVWARRMAAYKRPELLVTDLKRLAQVARAGGRPVQFVVAGRANPADAIGVELMKQVMAAAQFPKLNHHFAYLPAYNPASAKLLVGGADLWLNTPIRGYEACGTSGMKASLNGTVQFSTSDGWADEIDLGSIGWRLPVDRPAKLLYDRIEGDIAHLFYARGDDGLPHGWIKLMRANMSMMLKRFTAARMLDDYYTKLYAAQPEQATSAARA